MICFRDINTDENGMLVVRQKLDQHLDFEGPSKCPKHPSQGKLSWPCYATKMTMGYLMC